MNRGLAALVLGLGVATSAGASGLVTLDSGTGDPQVLASRWVDGALQVDFPTGSPGLWVELPPGVRLVATGPEGRFPQAWPLWRGSLVRYGLWAPPASRLRLIGFLPPHLALKRLAPPPLVLGTGWLLKSDRGLEVRLPGWKAPKGGVPRLRLVDQPAGTATLLGPGPALGLRFRSPEAEWTLEPRAWDLALETLRFAGPGPRRLEVTWTPPGEPLEVDAETLLRWPTTAWRGEGREWFRWRKTELLVLVTDTYARQDAYLKRLAFFVEKTGTRGTLVSNADLEGRHGWNAHDYQAVDLAAFFTEAARRAFPLNPEEEELREVLVQAGVLVAEAPGRWSAGQGALLGISHDSAPALRRVLFVHEAWHGFYFTSPAFRSAVLALWEALSPSARDRFRAFLARSSYDPANEDLMRNEFQAYLLQRPATDWEGFLRSRVVNAVGAAEADSLVAEYRTAAEGLDTTVRALFGVRSGDVFNLGPEILPGSGTGGEPPPPPSGG